MLNTTILMGRLTADPELRHTPNNVAVTSFTLACDRSYVKAGAERQVDFIDIVAWRNTAEFVSRYFRKGQLVAVQGSIQTRTYTDKDGNKRKAFEIVADNVHFAEPKRDSHIQPGGGYQNAGVRGGTQGDGLCDPLDISADDYPEQTSMPISLPCDDDLPF